LIPIDVHGAEIKDVKLQLSSKFWRAPPFGQENADPTSLLIVCISENQAYLSITKHLTQTPVQFQD
jgi:hypothetical protein